MLLRVFGSAFALRSIASAVWVVLQVRRYHGMKGVPDGTDSRRSSRRNSRRGSRAAGTGAAGGPGGGHRVLWVLQQAWQEKDSGAAAGAAAGADAGAAAGTDAGAATASVRFRSRRRPPSSTQARITTIVLLTDIGSASGFQGALRELELPEAAKVGAGGVAVGRERRRGLVAGGGVVGWCVGWLMAQGK